MANPIAKVMGGIIAGFIAGIIGYTVDLTIGAIFDAFGSIIPLIALLGIVYAIISFFIGVREDFLAGVFFSVGIIMSGFVLSDLVTILAGCVSFAGLIVVFISGDTSD